MSCLGFSTGSSFACRAAPSRGSRVDGHGSIDFCGDGEVSWASMDSAAEELRNPRKIRFTFRPWTRRGGRANEERRWKFPS
ncbi:hypothetical protein NL676_001463 [Syzygium grande]|nr:hypothetical protein NL676_001463 [Syzygium grande]